jgi:paraquat-inducible protein B
VRLIAGAAAFASCKNKAGLTALELAKRAKAHSKIVSLLQASQEAAEAEAARQRAQVEEDLLTLTTEETMNRKTKANKPKTRHTRKTKRGNTAQNHAQDENKLVDGDASVKENAVDTNSISIDPVNADATLALDATDAAIDDASEWVSVTDRKSRECALQAPSLLFEI